MTSPPSSLLSTEPVTVASAVTAALVATVNVLGLLLDWSAELIAALNLMLGAWVIAVAVVVRARVTPDANVALTHEQVAALEAARPAG
jgi:hypothetical protein